MRELSEHVRKKNEWERVNEIGRNKKPKGARYM